MPLVHTKAPVSATPPRDRLANELDSDREMSQSAKMVDPIHEELNELRRELGELREGLANLYSYGDFYKSQFGQDRWVVQDVMQYKRNGFFLDLAAADGVKYSNSHVLEKLYGWQGICIEPNPEQFRRLRRYRSCILDASVISNRSEQVEFRTDNGMGGGIVAEDTDNRSIGSQGATSRAEPTIVKLNAVTLDEVLEKHNAPPLIDYFSLDVEGSELRVLQGLSFDRYRFNAITIERPNREVQALLQKNGYVFVKKSGQDSFLVHESIAHGINR